MKKIITEPLVTIVVRTFNRPFTLKRALKSILNQSYPALEVVVVDDGLYKINPEYENAFHKKCPVKTVTSDKRGRSFAANQGIKHAKGKFVIFLDDDDEFYPDHVQTLVNGVMKHQSIVYSDCEMSFEDYDEKTDTFSIKKQYVRFSNDFNRGLLFARNYIPLMTLCFPADLLKKAGGFDENIDLYEDWDLLLRLSFESNFVHIPEVTAKYRIWSSGQITAAQNPKDNRDYFRVASKYMEKMTPEDLYQLSLYSEAHFNERDSSLEETKGLAKENQRILDEMEALQKELLVQREKNLDDNKKIIKHKQTADKYELEILKLQREIKKLQQERKKESLWLGELRNINQLYVDENVRKEEYIASMEHEINSLKSKQEAS